jgi:phage terminase small subunit
MQRGRKTQPSRLTPRDDAPLNPPDDFNPIERRAWDWAVSALEAENRLTKTDEACLEMYARSYGNFMGLYAESLKTPRTTNSASQGARLHPIHGALINASADVQRALASLKLTPKTRGQTQAKEQDDGASHWAGVIDGAQ